METLLQDLRFTLRMFGKRPGFTAMAVIALALGIGANTAIFSAVNAVLLRPLPFADPDRLVMVYTGEQKTGRTLSVSYPDYLDWRERNQTFESLAAVGATNFILTGMGEAGRITGEMASEEYFKTLGISAALGRTFLAEENRTPDSHPVTVVSYSFWQTRMGADPDVLGKALKLNDELFTIIGVMPEGFNGFMGEAQLWVPMMAFDRLNPSLKQYQTLSTRSMRWHQAVGRLKNGASMEQAQGDLDAIAASLAQVYPKPNEGKGIQIVSAYRELVGDFQPALLILLGAVSFLLLIACANVANLTLARAMSRGRELAIRSALGARRGRIIRQLLTESLLLALVGGALGILLASWGLRLIASFIPVKLPSFVAIGVDGQALAFTLLISVLTGALFGLLPALRASKPNLTESLKEGASSSGYGIRNSRLRSLLVVSEIAMAFVLLIGAGLMVKSFQRMLSFDPGFRTDNLMTMRIGVPGQKYMEKEKATLLQRLIERVETLPSVQSAGLTSHVYFGGGYMNAKMVIEGDELSASEGGEPAVYLQFISPNYLTAMGIPVLEGREFTKLDDDKSPQAVIVSRKFAESRWPNESALGKRIKFKELDVNNPWLEIVGVVGEVKPRLSLTDSRAFPQIYRPMFQTPIFGEPGLVVRTSIDPKGVMASLRQEAAKLDADMPVFRVSTMEELLADRMSDTRFTTLLMSLFGLLALVLTAVGIYAVISYSVSQRTREIGIRMSLGARRGDVLRLVMKQSMLLALTGVAIGLAGALALTGVMTGLLYEVRATDPATFIGISALLLGVALAAGYVPARRAARVDPIDALRCE